MIKLPLPAFSLQGIMRLPSAMFYHLEIVMLFLLVGVFVLGLWIFFTFAWQPLFAVKQEEQASVDGMMFTVPTAELLGITEVIAERKTIYESEPDVSQYPDVFRGPAQ